MKKAAFVVLAVAVLTLPILTLSDAFAFRGGQQGGPGYGQGHPGHPGPVADLSEKDMEKLEAERAAFLKETKDLRYRIEDKEWELGRELRADKPDEKKAVAVQRELSDLRGQMDQKVLAHRLKMRNLFPDFFANGFGPGPGCGAAFGPGDGGGCGGQGGMRGGGRGPCSR
ncbi:MAG: periplasmic heavy metal sensor [Deltaproteobacteria bacterium]|nr:periplasmic heavy metal sensor [Deltaproteobacteria bacterium]